MSISRTRKSRFGNEPGSHMSYTPTVSRALIVEESPPEGADRVTPSDFVPASGRDSWEEFEHIPMEGNSDLPLPLVTQHDGDDAPMRPLQRTPRDSLDLGSDSMVPAPHVPSQPAAPAPPLSQQAAPASPLGGDGGAARTALVQPEHPLWASARALLASEQREAAADVLERLCAEQPAHEPARTAVLQLSALLGRTERVGVHTAWLLSGHLQSQRAADACVAYQRVRAALPTAPLPEVALVAALSAADATGAGAIVLDATNMLLKLYPTGAQTPRALLIAAKHQFSSGAGEAGVQTLRYVAANFPKDGAAELARRKLAELGIE